MQSDTQKINTGLLESGIEKKDHGDHDADEKGCNYKGIIRLHHNEKTVYWDSFISFVLVLTCLYTPT